MTLSLNQKINIGLFIVAVATALYLKAVDNLYAERASAMHSEPVPIGTASR